MQSFLKIGFLFEQKTINIKISKFTKTMFDERVKIAFNEELTRKDAS